MTKLTKAALCRTSPLLLLLAAASPAWAQPAAQPLPAGKKGLLTVTVTTQGLVHRSDTQKERRDWTILRKAEFRTPLVSVMSSTVDLMEGQKAVPIAVPKMSGSQAQMLERLQKAMRSCKPDDQSCLMAAAQRIAASSDAPLPSPPQDMPAVDMDVQHFQMWQAERGDRTECATGSASVHETMDGNGLSDSAVAMWAIEGFRNGETKLPSKSWPHSCDTEVSFDRRAGTYTLRIGGLRIDVPTEEVIQRKGMPRSASKRTPSYDPLEYTKIPLKDDGLVLKGLKGTPETAAGSVTYGSVAPSETRSVAMTTRIVPNVKTTVTWHLTLE